MKIFVVLVRYDYEGELLDSVWDNEKDANARCEILRKQSYGDEVVVEDVELNKKNLLLEGSPMVWN